MKAACEATSLAPLSCPGGLQTWGCASSQGNFVPGLTSFPWPSLCLSWYQSKPRWFPVLFLQNTSEAVNAMSSHGSFCKRVRSFCEMKREPPFWSSLPKGRHLKIYDLASQWKGSDQNQLSGWVPFKSTSSSVILASGAKYAEKSSPC